MKKELSEKRVFCESSCGKDSLSCPDCNRENQSLVELINLSEEEEMKLLPNETVLLYCRQGKVCLSSLRQEEFLLADNQLVLLLPGENIYLRAETGVSLLLWKVNEITLFYEYLRVEEDRVGSEGFFALNANLHTRNMFGLFTSLLEEGFYCPEYIKGKLNELFILMRSFYSKRELVDFFLPLQSIDHAFKKKVLSHFSDARTVEELASRLNLSRSGFHQSFKKVVGTSPARWMKEEKAKQIFSELTLTDKPLKQIWIEQGFSSASYFNQFCRQHLGDAPSNIRKKAADFSQLSKI